MIKKILKGTGIAVAVTIALGGSFAAHEWYADKPFMMRSLLDREMMKIAFDSPETLTSLGFLESVGITNHNAELDDDRPQQLEKMFVTANRIQTLLNNYDNNDLNESDKLSKEISLYLLDFVNSSYEYRHHNYPVNQLFGLQNGFPSFMQAQHQVNSIEDAENYISRLNKLPVKFSQNIEGLKIREDKGILPPKFVVERVLEEMQNFVDKPIKENILYASLEEKLEKISDIEDQEKQRVLKQTHQAIKQSIHPAYNQLITYFEQLEPKTGNDHGFWNLPNGDKAYKKALQFFTTTDYSAEHIHRLGLTEVDRIQGQILSELTKLNINADNFTQAIEVLADNEKYYYPDTDEGRQQILADYQTILDEINANLDDAFNIRPKAGMEVVRIPEFKEKTSPGAYYQGPSLDGSRPGRFFANLYDIKATPTYSMRTLAYHEGVPGHHFQIAIAQELEGLPFIRKMGGFTAYSEGWALYAEQLAWELGFQKKPEDNIGRLQAELFRAVRLVVDTGIHHKRWTREQAIKYMKANTGMTQSDVVSEIERYIVMPGQATSYKIGMMKILELREKAKSQLGDKFDLAEFHDVVLKNGPVPLSILERLVDGWIKDKNMEQSI
ncbi:DUF885 domain-containing protein [Shewanella sp. 202IG2-18]|uniref:DUF885 domain-containing protein n=1 Tax=Parashewanella hymeniacidonis TaxID=2807618 RepID=UPI00196030E3|nr:DUF885 domain-containing protein [Parashewanella hymeniacidonis]MBM7071277.1 DUF885 domain-containing protein [Parashewanella hymeniacidonis]